MRCMDRANSLESRIEGRGGGRGEEVADIKNNEFKIDSRRISSWRADKEVVVVAEVLDEFEEGLRNKTSRAT